MSYTEKSLNVITVLLTILIVICLCLIYYLISFFNISEYHKQNVIYSKAFPIYDISNNVQAACNNENIKSNLVEYKKSKEITVSKISNLQQSMEKAEDIRNSFEGADDTEREITSANKNVSWRVEIPALNLNAHIQEGTSASILLKSVGHIENTSKWDGNVCLSAHNRGYQCNFFKDIKNLKVGDEIIYHTEQGKRVYKVQMNKTILETDLSYIKETEDNRITLITCEENRREYRRCIQAVQVSEDFI